MHPEIEQLLFSQDGVVARWQMKAVGVTQKTIEWQMRGLRRLQSGVYVSGHAPVSDRQLFWSAVLTAPGSALAQISCAQAYGINDRRTSAFVTIVRPGRAPGRRYGDVLVTYSSDLAGDLTDLGGLPVTTPARTIADLCGHLPEKEIKRMVRDSLRLGLLDSDDLNAAVSRGRGRVGIGVMRAAALEYRSLAARRTRSDAELLGLALLREAGVPAPQVNVRRAGFEADLSWVSRKVIVELDGPSFHRFAAEDARRDAAWRDAGWCVARIRTGCVYDEPAEFVERVRRALGQR